MGSSLRVTPAADIPAEVAERGGRLVICNLQKTPLDRTAAMCIHAFCDTVIQMLFEKLGLEIPPFKLTRRIQITKTSEKPKGQKETKQCLLFQGIDSDDCPYSLFPKIEYKQKGGSTVAMTREPMKIYSQEFHGMAEAKIFFQGHYGETPVTVTFDTESITKKTYIMVFDPNTSQWDTVSEI